MNSEEITQAIKRYEEQRVRDKPDDRALDALGRSYAGCSPHHPCPQHLLEAGVVEPDDVLLPS